MNFTWPKKISNFRPAKMEDGKENCPGLHPQCGRSRVSLRGGVGRQLAKRLLENEREHDTVSQESEVLKPLVSRCERHAGSKKSFCRPSVSDIYLPFWQRLLKAREQARNGQRA